MITSNTYPVDFGYKVSVEIFRDTEEDRAYVEVIAPMYVRKRWRMVHAYKASHFSDSEILRDSDFIRAMFDHYPTYK